MGDVSPGDVLHKLAQARATCAAGAVAQALAEVETAREWMRRMNCGDGTLHTHHAFGTVDAYLAAARTAVEREEADADKHLQSAIMQAQSATQAVATAEPVLDWG